MQKLTNIAKRLYETPEVEAVSVELEHFVAQSEDIGVFSLEVTDDAGTGLNDMDVTVLD